jgi:hypothetical protein
LEHAQTIANHESPRTTKLYDRTREELSAEEIGRIKSEAEFERQKKRSSDMLCLSRAEH